VCGDDVQEQHSALTDDKESTFDGGDAVVVNEVGHLRRHRPPRVVGAVVAALQPARHVAADVLQVDAADRHQLVRVRVTALLRRPADEARRNDDR